MQKKRKGKVQNFVKYLPILSLPLILAILLNSKISVSSQDVVEIVRLILSLVK